jgi:hypothetical protein
MYSARSVLAVCTTALVTMKLRLKHVPNMSRQSAHTDVCNGSCTQRSINFTFCRAALLMFQSSHY